MKTKVEEDVNGFTLSLLLKVMSRAQEFMGRGVKTCLFMLAASYALALGVGEFAEIWALDHPFKVFQTKCKGLPNLCLHNLQRCYVLHRYEYFEILYI